MSDVDVDIPNGIVLYWYTFSPYARRLAWYLQLRGISFAQCMQPAMLPRPDLEALNINYRRIPILSIGRDFYCDTRLILKKLEELYPEGALGSPLQPEHHAIERLLERWTADSGVFGRAAGLIPTNAPMLRNEAWTKDREGLTGGRPGSWSAERMEKGRPENLVYIRDCFELLETSLLADGRQWVFKTDKPSLGDIEAIWPFHWLVDMKTLPPNIISATQFPKVFAWIQRFRLATKLARESGPDIITVKGPQVAAFMQKAKLREMAGEFDVNDPLGLQPEDFVEVWPIDTGSSHKERGQLMSLTPSEVVIAKKTNAGQHDIQVHFPRWGFRIAKVSTTKL